MLTQPSPTKGYSKNTSEKGAHEVRNEKGRKNNAVYWRGLFFCLPSDNVTKTLLSDLSTLVLLLTQPCTQLYNSVA